MITIEEIKQTIPHRFPILLVDRVTNLELNKSIKAYKNITANEDVFNGHFPSQAIYPGIYTIEGLAQAGTILAFKSLELNSNSLVFFAGIDNVKFKRQVIPGDRLDYECVLSKFRKNLFVMETTAYVDEEIVATATLKAIVKHDT